MDNKDIPVGYAVMFPKVANFGFKGLTIFEARDIVEKYKHMEHRVYYIPVELKELSGDLYGRY